MSTTGESNLVTHARRELEIAGLFDDDSDYGGDIGRAVISIVEVFSGQGHSGFSAAMTTDIAVRLLRYENLTPLTDNPDDWMNVSEMPGQEMWQNRRRSDAFSTNGGKTYYLLNEAQDAGGMKVMHTSEPMTEAAR